MRSRWQTIVRLSVCVILTWTVIDLVAPQLCAAEQSAGVSMTSHQSDESPVDRDADCFCCSHTVSPMTLDVAFTLGTRIVIGARPPHRLALGVPRTLYHPPLTA